MLFWLLYIVLPFHGELKFLNSLLTGVSLFLADTTINKEQNWRTAEELEGRIFVLPNESIRILRIIKIPSDDEKTIAFRF